MANNSLIAHLRGRGRSASRDMTAGDVARTLARQTSPRLASLKAPPLPISGGLPTPADPGNTGPWRESSFLIKLRVTLDQIEKTGVNRDLLRWTKPGEEFVVCSRPLFAVGILKPFFGINSYSEFRMELKNTFHFQVSRDAQGRDTFQHPAFVRGTKAEMAIQAKVAPSAHPDMDASGGGSSSSSKSEDEAEPKKPLETPSDAKPAPAVANGVSLEDASLLMSLCKSSSTSQKRKLDEKIKSPASSPPSSKKPKPKDEGDPPASEQKQGNSNAQKKSFSAFPINSALITDSLASRMKGLQPPRRTSLIPSTYKLQAQTGLLAALPQQRRHSIAASQIEGIAKGNSLVTGIAPPRSFREGGGGSSSSISNFLSSQRSRAGLSNALGLTSALGTVVPSPTLALLQSASFRAASHLPTAVELPQAAAALRSVYRDTLDSILEQSARQHQGEGLTGTSAASFANQGLHQRLQFRLFLENLSDMLGAAARLDFEHVVCWQPDGKAFCIRDKKTFQNAILPHFFSEKISLPTFLKTLKDCGFSEAAGSTGVVYSHPLFVKFFSGVLPGADVLGSSHIRANTGGIG